MATLVKSFAISGIDAYEVDIEIKLLDGQPMISIIGLGDQAVKEAGERIISALDECSFEFPKKKVIISLAPSDKKKSGSHYDLAMAIGVLQENGDIAVKNLQDYAIFGELSLNGRLRGCRGVLPMIIAAQKIGYKKIVVPKVNMQEARLVRGVELYGFDTLDEVIGFLENKITYEEYAEPAAETVIESGNVDFSDVRGQAEVIDAVLMAAAGGHNMLMIGEPGCGKTMISQRIPGILPEMTEEECLEVTKIYSIAGLLAKENDLMCNRPFRAPHHNASLNALIGGGMNAMPGEVSLAHNGVLFLDELGEFSRRTLDALRQPVEDKKVTISRVNGTHTFPSNFMFVAAMNPCPCGYYPSNRCRCTDYEIIKYRGRISGPILDRIDIQKIVKPVSFFEQETAAKSRSSKQLREIVVEARKIQEERYKNIPGIHSNMQMTTDLLQQHCVLQKDSIDLLKETSEKYGYSARVIHKLMRLARTAADLDGVENVRLEDIEKVLSYRELDKSNSEMVVVAN